MLKEGGPGFPVVTDLGHYNLSEQAFLTLRQAESLQQGSNFWPRRPRQERNQREVDRSWATV